MGLAHPLIKSRPSLTEVLLRFHSFDHGSNHDISLKPPPSRRALAPDWRSGSAIADESVAVSGVGGAGHAAERHADGRDALRRPERPLSALHQQAERRRWAEVRIHGHH
jgi:hypothetical protein